MFSSCHRRGLGVMAFYLTAGSVIAGGLMMMALGHVFLGKLLVAVSVVGMLCLLAVRWPICLTVIAIIVNPFDNEACTLGFGAARISVFEGMIPFMFLAVGLRPLRLLRRLLGPRSLGPPLLACYLLVLLSLALSGDCSFDSVTGEVHPVRSFYTYSKAFLMFCLILVSSDDPRRIRIAWFALLLACVVNSLAVLCNAAVLAVETPGAYMVEMMVRPKAFTIHANVAATVALIGFAMAGGYFCSLRGLKRSFGFVMAMASCAAAVAATLTRSAALCVAATSAALVSLRGRRRLRHIGIGLFCAMAGGLLLAAASDTFLSARLLSTFDIHDASKLERVLIWRYAIRCFLESPLTGIGVGRFNAQWQSGFFRWYAVPAHSLYLHVAATTGLVGIVALGWLIAGIIRQARFLFRRSSSDDAQDGQFRALGVGAAVAMFALGVMGLVNSLLYPPTSELVAAVMAIMTCVYQSMTSRRFSASGDNTVRTCVSSADDR